MDTFYQKCFLALQQQLNNVKIILYIDTDVDIGVDVFVDICRHIFIFFNSCYSWNLTWFLDG